MRGRKLRVTEFGALSSRRPIWDRLGRILHAGTGCLTESGRRVRIRDKRGRPIRAFPVGWEGPVFLTRSCRLALDGMSDGVKLTDDYSFTWFFTTERSEKPVNFFQVMSLSCGLN